MSLIKKITHTSLFASLIIAAEFFTDFLPKMPNGGSLNLRTLVIVIGIIYLLTFAPEKEVFQISFLAAIITIVIGAITTIYSHIVLPFGLIFDYIIPLTLPTFLIYFIKKSTITLIFAELVISGLIFSSYVLSGMIVWNVPLWGSIIYNISYYWPMFLLTPITTISFKKILFK